VHPSREDREIPKRSSLLPEFAENRHIWKYPSYDKRGNSKYHRNDGVKNILSFDKSGPGESDLISCHIQKMYIENKSHVVKSSKILKMKKSSLLIRVVLRSAKVYHAIGKVMYIYNRSP